LNAACQWKGAIDQLLVMNQLELAAICKPGIGRALSVAVLGRDRGVTKAFGTCVRIIVAMVFVVAGLGKIRDPESFQGYLYALGQCPPILAGAIVVLLPCLELAVGICLLATPGSLLVAVLAWVLSLGFTLTSLYAFLISTKSRCPCMPGLDVEALSIGAGMIARNVGIACMTSFLLWVTAGTCARGGSALRELG
jgi:uncharacterized membrane protein YphA (DoxX/SURF4 family)